MNSEDGEVINENVLEGEINEEYCKGTFDYRELDYKPKINGLELNGDLTPNDLGLQPSEEGKGLSTNDFTNEEKHKLESLSNYDDNDIKDKVSKLENNKANRDEIPDVSEFITKDVNNLTNYELKTNTGSSIFIDINSYTYVMTIKLKNSANEVLSEGSIDLPLETMVVNASYDNLTKEIVLTLQSGTEVRFSVSDLVSGLVSESKLNEELIKKVSKEEGKGLSSNDYTTEEKNKLAGLSNYDDTELRNKIGNIDTVLETLTVGSGV